MIICWYPISAGRRGIPADNRGKYLPGRWFRDYLERGITYYYLKREKPLQRRFQKLVEEGKRGEGLFGWLKGELEQELKPVAEIEIGERLYLDPKKCSKELVKVQSRGEGFVAREWREVFTGSIEVEISIPKKLETPLHSYSRGLGEFLHKLAKGNQEVEEVVTEVQNRIANEWRFPFLIGEWSWERIDPLFLHCWSLKELRQKLDRKGYFPKTLLYIPRLNQILGWTQVGA
ncbi:MAG: hypothetical protein ABGW77_06605 [Campylobacterales bacterium]